MKVNVPKLTVSLLIGLFSTLQLSDHSPSAKSPSGRKPVPVGIGDVRSFRAAYDSWKAKVTRYGGDRNLVLALGYSKGLSAEFTKARGLARLDVVDGSVSVQVSGLAETDALDVWLIDNRPGPGQSVKPQSGDAMVRLGGLTREADRGTLEAQLDRTALAGFEIDLIVVARAGQDPGEAGILFGSVTLFQRLYHSELRQQFASLGQTDAPHRAHSGPLGLAAAPFRALIPSPAHAAGTGTMDVEDLIARGEDLYFNEQFEGNGRTCGTCHPAENNFTIDPTSIAKLPDTDPLFVAEFIPELNSIPDDGIFDGEFFEIPAMMRSRGLILENIDGFEDRGNKFVLRGVPHVLALSTSIEGPQRPDGTPVPFDNTAHPNPDFAIIPPLQRTGWSGDGTPRSDGLPGAGNLRDFAMGAVIQHFTLTLDRVEGTDFRLPDDDELDALAAFLRSLGRQQELDLAATNFPDPIVSLGQELFNRLDKGKCVICHSNAGANIDAEFFSGILGPLAQLSNANFGTGVNDLPNLPGDRIAELAGVPNPPDGGFGLVDHSPDANGPGMPPNCVGGRPGAFGTVTPGGVLPAGLCEEDFNTPPLVEAADTPPFFHNNAVATIEAAVAFYNDDAFNNSIGAGLIGGIRLASTEVTAIAAFLRVLNALENIRNSIRLLNLARDFDLNRATARRQIRIAQAETLDAIEVLRAGGLHAVAIEQLEKALKREKIARRARLRITRIIFSKRAIRNLEAARDRMVN